MSIYIMKTTVIGSDLQREVIGFDPASGTDVSVSTGIRTDNKSHDEIIDVEKGFLARCVVINGRKCGKSTMNKQLIDSLCKKPELTYRRCDCLKCRMGKPDQCTTYSPKKR